MNNGFIFKNGGIKRMPVENGNALVGASGEPTKVCAGCGRELPLSAFDGHPRSADGKMKVCHECRHRRSAKEITKTAKSNPLAQFTARELMKELKARGYEGILEYTTVQRINISDM